MPLNSFFTIPNQKAIFELSGSELKILTALRAVTYQNKEFLILSQKAKQEILDLLSKTYSTFKPIQRIISRLVTKGIIWIEKSGLYFKVLFQHSKSAISAPPYIISKEDTSKEGDSPACLKKDQTEVPSFLISEQNHEGMKIIDSKSDDLRHTKIEKGVNVYQETEPTLKTDKNDVKIDSQYVKALKLQLQKYRYDNNDIETISKLIYRAKAKNIPDSRIDDLAKSIIYNRIDKSVKHKPIYDIKAYIISALFSKEEKFIFHKLDHVNNFPYSEIRSESDIKFEEKKQKENEALKLQAISIKHVQEEQEQFENMEQALKEKLKDKFDVEFLKTKQNIIKQTGNPFIPWPTVITSLYEIVFNSDMSLCSVIPEQVSC